MAHLVIFMVVMSILMVGSSRMSIETLDKIFKVEKVDNIIQKKKLIKNAVEFYCKNEVIADDGDLPDMTKLVDNGYLVSFDNNNEFNDSFILSFDTSKNHYYEFTLKHTIDDAYALSKYTKTFKNNYFGTKVSCDEDPASATFGDCVSPIIIEGQCK